MWWRKSNVVEEIRYIHFLLDLDLAAASISYIVYILMCTLTRLDSVKS